MKEAINPRKIVVFTGAGVSAESGLQTFRDANGLWNNYPVSLVATPQGWLSDPELVLDFIISDGLSWIRSNPIQRISPSPHWKKNTRWW